MITSRTRPTALSLGLALAVHLPLVARSEVVFDNTPNLVNATPQFYTSQEYGDELFLAGTARDVTEFQFAYYGNFGATPGVSYSVRFYANDGTDAVPGAATALRPRSLLWDSGPQDLSNGVNKVTLTVPNVRVPDHFTWSISFKGIDGTPGKQASLMLANPATIGGVLAGTQAQPTLIGSYDDFWKKDDADDANSWMLYMFGYGPDEPKGNFFTRVTAVSVAPQLTILPAGNQVILSWPAAATAYVLESRADLSAGTPWTALVAPPTIENGFNRVTNNVAPGQAFYRLHRP